MAECNLVDSVETCFYFNELHKQGDAKRAKRLSAVRFKLQQKLMQVEHELAVFAVRNRWENCYDIDYEKMAEHLEDY